MIMVESKQLVVDFLDLVTESLSSAQTVRFHPLRHSSNWIYKDLESGAQSRVWLKLPIILTPLNKENTRQ